MSSNNFCVLKRNGEKQEVSFDKVTRRIKKLCYNLNEHINHIVIAQKVCSQIYNNVTTKELDELAAQICRRKRLIMVPCTVHFRRRDDEFYH